MQVPSEDILQQFREKARFGISPLLSNTLSFFENDYPIIEKYYEGKVKEVPRYEFREFESVKEQLQQLYDVIEQNSQSLTNIAYLSIIKLAEDLDSILSSIQNLDKWMRCSSINGEFSKDIQVEYSLNQGETVENLSFSRIGDGEYRDSWFDLSINNKLLETGYQLEGGQVLKVTFPNSPFEIESVAGLIEGESIYGRDIDRNFTFENDDIKTVFGKRCLKQTADTLLGLKKGDNPDDLSQGLDKNISVGTNVNSVNFPIVLRQLTSTFATDDTISSFSLTGIKRDQDSVSIEFEIIGRLGDSMISAL